MKNSVWIGISISMLASVAQASSEDSVLTLQSDSGVTLNSEAPPVLKSLGNGKYQFIRPDGNSIELTDENINWIKSLKIDETPEFGISMPCVFKSN